MKLEQQLKQLSSGGLAAALLLMIVLSKRSPCTLWKASCRQCGPLARWLPLFLPCLWYGLVRLRQIVQTATKSVIGPVRRVYFVLSALKIPSVTGSCSHPTGVGTGGYPVRTGVVAILGAIVLLLSLAVAHGGLTTLGANGMSMAVVAR